VNLFHGKPVTSTNKDEQSFFTSQLQYNNKIQLNEGCSQASSFGIHSFIGSQFKNTWTTTLLVLTFIQCN